MNLKRLLSCLLALFLVLGSFAYVYVPTVYATTDLMDSYSQTNRDAKIDLSAVHPSSSTAPSAAGQCFTSSGNYQVTIATFYLAKTGSPVGNLVAVLYDITGTFGTNGKPTGDPLATSDTLAMSGLTTSYVLYNFTFSTPYTVSANNYCIDVEVQSATMLDASFNYTMVGIDASSPTHAGNRFRYASSTWATAVTQDVCFYVYGILQEGDTTKPLYNSSSLGTNTTRANSPILFYVNCSDETGLSGFMLQHNNSGTVVNTTWVTFVSLGAGNTWANSTITSNYTVGYVIQWNIIFNDTSNNWNATMPWQNLTLTFYAELTIVTATHSWSITPGQSNVTITQGTINVTVTANVNFTLQAKGNGNLAYGANTIALSNVLIHKDTLASAIAITTDYQNIPGLTNQAYGTSQAKTCILWLTCPTGKPSGNYVYTLSIQVIQA